MGSAYQRVRLKTSWPSWRSLIPDIASVLTKLNQNRDEFCELLLRIYEGSFSVPPKTNAPLAGEALKYWLRLKGFSNMTTIRRAPPGAQLKERPRPFEPGSRSPWALAARDSALSGWAELEQCEHAPLLDHGAAVARVLADIEACACGGIPELRYCAQNNGVAAQCSLCDASLTQFLGRGHLLGVERHLLRPYITSAARTTQQEAPL
jgi:hypothetical protein